MCDYSLHNVKTRPAKVSDKLSTRNFGTGTRGFSASEDHSVAVCVLPGTELSFADEIKITRRNPWPDVHFEIPRLGQNLLAFLGSCHQMDAPLLSAAFRLSIREHGCDT